MKKFRFNYSLPVGLLILLVILISGAGIVLNVMTAVKYYYENTFSFISYTLLAVLTVILFTESVAIAFYGLYKVKNGYLYSCFGLIYTKTALTDIVEAKVFSVTQKLVLYLSKGKYTVIIISPEKFADFISELIKSNPDIRYGGEVGEPA